MIQRVDPTLVKEIEKYGKDTWNNCFHCGNCTAVCPLTEENSIFPRKYYGAMQMGLRETIESSVEPWLCYYCGDCSQTCPRDANPGETMMTLRRYLTSVYDWTGLSKRIYTSKTFEIAAILVLAIFVFFLFINFTTYPTPGGEWIGSDGGVLINKMAPAEIIHIGDLILAGMLAFLLLSNVFNMWRKIIYKDKSIKIPLLAYLKEIRSLILNFFTQRKFKKCEGPRTYWYVHLLFVVGYISLFVMIVFFLEWFQTDEVHPIWHPQRSLGYLATIALFVGIFYWLYHRIKKASEKSKYSHYTDWTFLILLFLTTLSGILLHFFRINGMPEATYITYLLHLMILVPMLIIEVPFSKWSHLAYRPVAIYFANVKKYAQNHQK